MKGFYLQKDYPAIKFLFAVKEFGFGVRAYANSQYGAGFEPLLATYVESGIPVIALIENDQGIGHAINIIGRKSYNRYHIDSLQQTDVLAGGNKVYDFATMPMQYVMVDDNFPPYQLAYLNNPVSYYNNPKWAGCSITSFVVPLYSKIYLEAGEARQMALQILNLVPFAHTEAIVVKTFLASSRSFKHSLALNNLLEPTAKELLVNTSMPKFVWITEITTRALLEQHLCTGLIIADATEPFRMGVIACLAEDIYLTFTHTNITQAVLPLPPFTMYHHNLKLINMPETLLSTYDEIMNKLRLEGKVTEKTPQESWEIMKNMEQKMEVFHLINQQKQEPHRKK